MADLKETYVKDTYHGVLNIVGTSGTAGLTDTLKTVTDGDGVALPIRVSTTELSVKNLSIDGYGPVINEAGEWIGEGATTADLVTAKNLQLVSIGDFADDAAAATGGVPIGGLYHTAGAVKVRLT